MSAERTAQPSSPEPGAAPGHWWPRGLAVTPSPSGQHSMPSLLEVGDDMKIIKIAAVAGVAAVLASACGLLGDGASAPPSQPVIITNNIPSGNDSGSLVLLTISGIAAFLLLGVAIVAGMLWFAERRRRVAAEDIVVALTGRPISQLSLTMAPPISVERLQAMATPRKELQR